MNKIHIYYDCIHQSNAPTISRTWSYDYALSKRELKGRDLVAGFTGQKYTKYTPKVGCIVMIRYKGEIVAKFPKGSAGKDINNFIDSYFENELRKAKLALI
jgi:hypothetical protein